MKVTIAQCEAALRAQIGQVRHAADDLGISPQALYGRISRSKRLQEVLRDIEGRVSEVSVKTVVRAIYQGDVAAARFWLERKAKAEGWSARTEITGADSGPIDFGFDRMSDEEILALYRKLNDAAS